MGIPGNKPAFVPNLYDATVTAVISRPDNRPIACGINGRCQCDGDIHPCVQPCASVYWMPSCPKSGADSIRTGTSVDRKQQRISNEFPGFRMQKIDYHLHLLRGFNFLHQGIDNLVAGIKIPMLGSQQTGQFQTIQDY